MGGGLAGCEACYQLLKRGVDVTLVEMKKIKKSPAHNMDGLCELVCSNSLKSMDINTASGLLKAELDMLDSMVLRVARQCAVPAGNALAVDRDLFSEKVTECLKSYGNLTFVDGVEDKIFDDDFDAVIVATGPLTDEALVPAMKELFGSNFLYFFDAVAPIVTADSLDRSRCFTASRYGKGDSDYINCPMEKDEFIEFYRELVSAETVPVKDFENNVFEGCMPIEVMAGRGQDTIRFGPLKPVGLTDPNTGKRPYAVLQLRSENAQCTLYNLVGFQTHLRFGEQKRVFSMIPALKDAEFVRYGVMHRNTYINAPEFLDETFRLKNSKQNIYFAGQMTGVEGYVESLASGLVAGVQCFNRLSGLEQLDFTDCTIIGALTKHVSVAYGKYSPMNSNFGILRPLEENIRDKSLKKQKLSERSLETMKAVLKL